MYASSGVAEGGQENERKEQEECAAIISSLNLSSLKSASPAKVRYGQRETETPVVSR